jgi:SWIM zinc finger
MVVSIVPQQTGTEPPAPRPIPGHSRRTGELVALVPSCSEPNVFHIVTPTSCSCKGYQFRGRCRHLAPVAPAADAEPLPCSSCHNYHRTDAERLQAHPDARRELAPGGAAHLQVLRAAGQWPS